MLTFADTPTIRNAILKRLDRERGIKVCDMPVEAWPDCIKVGILALLDDTLLVKSRFDLPLEFENAHLQNEIDEIAEQYKVARADYWLKGRSLKVPEQKLRGTGLRGRWVKHA